MERHSDVDARVFVRFEINVVTYRLECLDDCLHN